MRSIQTTHLTITPCSTIHTPNHPHTPHYTAHYGEAAVAVEELGRISHVLTGPEWESLTTLQQHRKAALQAALLHAVQDGIHIQPGMVCVHVGACDTHQQHDMYTTQYPPPNIMTHTQHNNLHPTS